MLIPLGTDRGLRRPSAVTPALVLLTVAAYVAMLVVQRTDAAMHGRLIESLAVVGGADFRWWQPLTCTLLHAGPLHLAGNVLFLWVFGQAVEDRYGRLGFLALYILGAYAAGLTHAALEREWLEIAIHSNEAAAQAWVRRHELGLAGPPAEGIWVYTPAIGASGAIAAVTGAFLVLFPRTAVRSLYLFTLGMVLVPAWWFIGMAVAWDFLAQGLGVGGRVARLAHLGGYALGISLSMALLGLRVFPREPYDLFTLFRQAHRRRQFRAAHPARPRPERAATAKASPQTRISDEVSQRRAEVSTLLAGGNAEEAAARYLALAREFAHVPGAATMSRRVQYDLAAHFVVAGAHGEAAAAYERLLEAYPDDREAGTIRVMLARLLRGLGREAEARDLLGAVADGAGDADELRLARQELDTFARLAGENGVA